MLQVTKKTKKCIVGGSAVVLAAVLAGSAVLSSTQTALAANPTLPGVDEIRYNNNNTNPFVILEVVPDKEDASLGFLIGGEEPVDESGRSIKDMPVANERTERFTGETASGKISNLGISDAVTYKMYEEPPVGDTSVTVDIRGEFVEVEGNGDYDLEVGEDQFTPVVIIADDGVAEDGDNLNELGEVNAAKETLYRRHMSFYVPQEDGAFEDTNVYGIQLRKLTENLKDPQEKNRDLLPYELEESGEEYRDIYNNQFFSVDKITQNTSLNENDLIFRTVEGQDTLEFVGLYHEADTLPDYTDGSYMRAQEADGDNLRDDLNYYYVCGLSVLGADEDGLRSVTDFVPVERPTNGYVEPVPTPEDTTVVPDYVFVDNTFYIMKGFDERIHFVGEGGDYRFDTDYTKDVYTTATYSGGFTNQEWFKKYVFDLNQKAEYEGMYIDVVTVTMEELSLAFENGEDLLATADMLYLAGTPENDSTYDHVYDGLSAGMAKAIFTAVEEGLPTVVNRSIYENYELNNGAIGNQEMVVKLAACLMHDDLAGIAGTNNFETLQLTALQRTMRKQSSDGSLTYVNDNIYVHDDWYSGKVNVVCKGFFEDTFSEAQINAGFTELIEEIENENFYLELAGKGKDERIPKVATIATAIRHILNAGGRRVVTKSALRVLDLEPYDFEEYYLTNNYNEGANRMDVYEDIRWPADHRNGRDGVREVKTINSDSICISNGQLNYYNWITTHVAPQFKGQESEKIQVDILGTKEFIGKVDDLNEMYDLIYIGMDTSIMNTNMTGSSGDYTKTKATVYNDEDMNGLVYSHVGDTTRFGFVDDKNNQVFTAEMEHRFPGNDINFEKLRELSEYIKAGYAMILSDDFFIKDSYSINTEKVDISSNIYKLVNEVVLARDEKGNYLYLGKNVNTKSGIEGASTEDKEVFNRYLNVAKLQIEALSVPKPWSEVDGYLVPDANGNYYLEFEVELQNDAAVEAEQTTYHCQLFVDVDNDGRYEAAESLTGLTIIDEDGDLEHADNDGVFHLSADDVYHIERELPDGYTGFISWKLQFVQNSRVFEDGTSDERLSVRSSITGYSAVKAEPDQVPTIRVLQITDDRGTGSTLDLDSQQMHRWYAGVTDFNIEIDQYNGADYIRRNWRPFNNETHLEFLNSYDMVVIGFGDDFRFGTVLNGENARTMENQIKDAALAIRAYALSGRSIMFAHDLTRPMDTYLDVANPNRASGWYFNNLLRDVQGMDRFGWVKEQQTNNNNIQVPLNNPLYTYNSVYDEPYLMGELLVDEASTNRIGKSVKSALTGSSLAFRDYKTENNLDIQAYEAEYGENARRASWYYQAHWTYANADNPAYGQGTGWREARWNETEEHWVSQVNSGQVTEYPYVISEEFQTTHTHAQYLQLNLDTDSRDEYDYDDVVVWYTLADTPEWDDSYFRALETDVRNNYYIYSKGNVFYTGCGDQNVTGEMEQKLFVNTLVAAYRTGVKAPRASFKDNEWKTSATIETLYQPYDSLMNVDANYEEAEGAYLGQNLQVYFYTTNMDLRQSSDIINARYYTDGSPTDYDLYTDGKYYKEIEPVAGSFNKIVEFGNTLQREPGTAHALTNNTMYSAQFRYSDVNLGSDPESVAEKNTTNIYVRLGYDALVNSRDQIALSATESISKLHVVCTQLFELR